jgi:hypothetical protein
VRGLSLVRHLGHWQGGHVRDTGGTVTALKCASWFFAESRSTACCRGLNALTRVSLLPQSASLYGWSAETLKPWKAM